MRPGVATRPRTQPVPRGTTPWTSKPSPTSAQPYPTSPPPPHPPPAPVPDRDRRAWHRVRERVACHDRQLVRTGLCHVFEQKVVILPGPSAEATGHAG